MSCAVSGLRFLLRSQRNAQCHAAATVAVVILGAVAQISLFQWCWVIAAAGGVWCAEAMNTSLECVCDFACVPPARHDLIRRSKDVAAGGVLCAAMAAATIGVCVLGPPLIGLFRRVL
jgi:diacylglycerol kinase (ATP)